LDKPSYISPVYT